MSEYEELKARLFNKKECGWENLREEEKTKIDTFGNEYIYFLNKCKTEREAVEFSKEILQKNGFIKEAHFVENFYYNNEFTDTVIYSLLKRNFKK